MPSTYKRGVLEDVVTQLASLQMTGNNNLHNKITYMMLGMMLINQKPDLCKSTTGRSPKIRSKNRN
jgi:hypothetical protein